MKILKNIELFDLSLFVDNTLVLTDFHIGYEEALNKRGVLVPRFQFKEIILRLEKIFDRLKSKKIEKIVVLGDLKHEFGIISEQEWRHTLKLIDFFGRHCSEIILLKGNHDKILGPIAEKRKVKVLEHYRLGKILCIHGDKLPIKKELEGISTIVMGHEHPAVSIKDNKRAETFKCFLVGKWERKNLVVVPSFNLVTEGTDVLKSRVLSPLLKQDLSNFQAIVVSDKLYDFGKLKSLD
ncbi:metallophosphoesterase [Candidatus Woesearchaeota archaeon]|nr:metallophosphoesterase [Candidatus Woesearchaeota archaeon]